MTRQLFLIVLSAMVLASCSRTKTEYWPNGNKKSEIGVNGGKYEGIAHYWYEDGTLQTSCTYRNNLVEGSLRSYYPSGRPQAEQSFTKGVLNGVAKNWDKSGQLVLVCSYRDGFLHGKYTEYYPNGTVKAEGTYLHGDHDGTWLYYDAGGMIVGEGNFALGTGIQKAFYENGHTKQLTHYTKNAKDGEEVFYKPDGTPDVINTYAHGKLINKIKK